MKGWEKIKSWFSGNHPSIKETVYREEEVERRFNWREALHEGFPRNDEERAGWTPPSYFDTSMLEEGVEPQSIREMLDERETQRQARSHRRYQRQYEEFLQDRRAHHAGREYQERREHEDLEEEVARRVRDIVRDDYVSPTIEETLRQPNHPEIEETRSAIWEIERKRIDIPEGVVSTKINECKYYGFCGEKTDKIHPDYVNEWICEKCLEERNKYEVH